MTHLLKKKQAIETACQSDHIYQEKTCWIMANSTLLKLRKMKDGDGKPLLQQDITKGYGFTLFGKHIYTSENAPEIESGKVAVVYGDMSGLYVKLAQNVEMQILHEKYATKHAVGVCAYVEFDSKIIETEKIAGLKMA